MEVLSPDAQLPTLHIRRADRIAERTLYVARPGLRAMPSGSMTVGAFVGMQVASLIILMWAVWWPVPSSRSDWMFAGGVSAVMLGLVVLVGWMLTRRHPGFLIAVIRAPFIRLSVTDRRIVWALPWMRGPLMEIGRDRVMGALLGSVDHKGAGSAALVLVPGDPCADIDGAIHFDRLPQVERFLEALGRG